MNRAIILSVFAALSFIATAVSASPLGFYRFKIESEPTTGWDKVVAIDREGTSEIFGIFNEKSIPGGKLMAFRLNGYGDKNCMNEFSKMRIQKQDFVKLKAPKGWACVIEMKGPKKKYMAVRSFFLRTKSRATPLTLVVSSEELPQDRFMKAVSSLKEESK